jgi:hypothetical protein
MKIGASVQKILFVCLCLALQPASVRAGTWLELESRYLGNGWFSYQVGNLWSPRMASINITSVEPHFGTNLVELGETPANWHSTNYPSGDLVWSVDVPYPHWQVRPYKPLFQARSSWTNCVEGRVILTMSLCLVELDGYTPGVSPNIVGYWIAPALVPSLEPPSNSVPPLLYTNLSFSDVVIQDLVRDSQGIKGISFTNETSATFLLETSANLTNWLRITYLYGVAGTNTWTTNYNLGQKGNFFRLQYVGDGHLPLTNLLPIAASSSLKLAATQASRPGPVQFSVMPEKESMKVQIQTKAGSIYQLQVSGMVGVAWS